MSKTQCSVVDISGGGACKDRLDLLARCFGAQGSDHGGDRACDKAGQDLIDARGDDESRGDGVGEAKQPCNVHNSTRQDACHSARVVKATPEQGKQHNRTEGSAEQTPRVFHHAHNAACPARSAGGDQECDHADDQHHNTADPQGLLFGSLVLADKGLVQVTGEGRRGYQQLRICGRHRCRHDGSEKQTGDDGREDVLRQRDEDGLLTTCRKQLFGKRSTVCEQEGTAEDRNGDGCAERQHHPDDGYGRCLLDLRGLFDTHKANDDVGHTEIAKTPGKTGYDIAPVGGEGIRLEGGDAVCKRAREGSVKAAHAHHDRHSEQGDQHHNALEKVRPTNCLVAAKEGVDQDEAGEQCHCKHFLVRKPRDHGDHNAFSGNEGRGNVNGKADQEDDRAHDFQNGVLGGEAVGQILGQGNGVARCTREAAQTLGDEDPVGGSTEGKTDTDPHLAHAEGENTAGEAHKKPAGHIRRLGTHSGDPRTHRTAAKEIVLFTIALGAKEEIKTHAQDQGEVTDKRDKLHDKSKLLSKYGGEILPRPC